MGKKPRPTLSWLDRAVLGIAPRYGMNRVRARIAVQMFARHYEAAATSRRTAGWRRSGTDADLAAARDLPALRELARDLRRNNGWAKRGVQAIVNNTVGWGIKPKAVAKSTDVEKRALEVWDLWAESIAADYEGRMPFYGIQRLVMETVVEAGEALVVREPASAADGLPVPLRIHVLEPDYLDGSRVEGPAGPVIQGVELDGRGRRAAYWLFVNHPGSARIGGARESRRVLASDVLHVYQIARPGQTRGVSWLAAAIAKLNDFDDYEDARLMQQKIAACFGAFVSDLDGAGKVLGEQDPNDEKLETLEPGHIEYLSPGQKVDFAVPPSTSDHASFTSTNLRRVAAALGVTYEDLTGDYSQVNFSSARMARLAHWANVHDWRWNMLIPQLCNGVWGWVTGTAAGIEGWPEVPRAEWSPPPMPMIEPDKEGLAYARLVRAGVMTLPQAIREQGYDPETHLQEIAAANQRLDELKIWLDSDPRRVSAAGLTQERVGSGGGGQGDGGGGQS